MILYKTFTALAACASLLLAAGCKQLQDTLSTVQQEDQDKGIGYATCDTKVFYYNGAEGDSVKGENAYLVLNLNQLADAEGASVAYTLEYKMDDGVIRTASNKGEGDISNGKTKYYVDLSPAINLIDGSGNPAHGDISYAFSVTGLKNAVQGSEHNGRTFPKFSTTVKFAPLFIKEQELIVSTKSALEGTTFTIPLNGKITDIKSDVDVEISGDEGVSESDVGFTASVSGDGTEIVIKTIKDITGKSFTATLNISGIKAVGVKDSYVRQFNVNFTSSSIVLDGVLDEDGWASAATSTDSYGTVNDYNLTKLYVTDDGQYLYVAIEGALKFWKDDRITLMVANDASDEDDGISNTTISSDNNFNLPATTSTFTGLDYYLSHHPGDPKWAGIVYIGTSGSDYENKNCSSSQSPDENTAAELSVVEYRVPLSSIKAATGDTLQVFVATSSYSWNEEVKNQEFVQDCIPKAAALISGSGATLAVDMSKALKYTVK